MYHPYDYGADKAAQLKGTALAEWESPRAWHLQQREKKLNMSTNGMTVKKVRGGEWEDKGIEKMRMLREQRLSIFFSLQTPKHLWKEVEEHCAEKLLIIGWLFIAVFVTLVCLSHKHLTEPHWPMNHRLKATALEMEGTVTKNQHLQGEEGGRYRRDTQCQEGGTEFCHFCDLDLQISNICI